MKARWALARRRISSDSGLIWTGIRRVFRCCLMLCTRRFVLSSGYPVDVFVDHRPGLVYSSLSPASGALDSMALVRC